jgi:TolB protein
MRRLTLLLLSLAAGCSPAEEPRRSKIAFAVDRAGTVSEIMLVDPEGGDPVPVQPADSTDEAPAWSPDGLTILFASNRDNQRGIYAWDRKLERIVMAAYRDTAPTWSPDGRRIAYMSDRDETWQIYSIGSTGRDEKRLTISKFNDTWPVWSPDGQTMLFLSDRGGQHDIYSMKVLPIERDPLPKGEQGKPLPPHPRWTEDPTPVTNDRAWDGRPAWSPDGKWIAWPSEREGKSAIWIMDASGKNARRVTPLDSEADEPSWSPDGKRIVFVSTRDGFRELYVQGVNEKNARRLTLQRGQIHTPAWSPALPPSK